MRIHFNNIPLLPFTFLLHLIPFADLANAYIPNTFLTLRHESLFVPHDSLSFVVRPSLVTKHRNALSSCLHESNIGTSGGSIEGGLNKAPTFNGKVVFPFNAVKVGLKGFKIAAVYAVLNDNYKRGSGEGWEHCEYVSITRDLDSELASHYETHGPDTVAHIRALSFAYPQKSEMEEISTQWRQMAAEAGGEGGNVLGDWDSKSQPDREDLVTLMKETAFFDDDDDDDEFEYDEIDDSNSIIDNALGKEVESTEEQNTTVSPFSEDSMDNSESSNDSKPLEFTKENVDKVLNEVRPYLISDGGNVSVKNVDLDTKNVYLVLEGACGSCSSSTVTMQMGIERVLKENFEDLGEVIQVEDESTEANKPTSLTLEAVQAEVNRIGPAISAMGGFVEIISVNPLGVVEIKFRGSNKLQQGLELALRDVQFVKHVKFVN